LELSALVREEMVALASHPMAEGLELSFDAPTGPVLVRGDAVTLREAIRNVLDNALRHGAGHRLAALVRTTGPTAFVEISDDGPGIPDDRWGVIVQPFTPRDGGRGGTSLGLAIVSEVMRSHHGALHFSRSSIGEFVVTLRLPTA
jgi:two-component system sensor histidine kinase TctE